MRKLDVVDIRHSFFVSKFITWRIWRFNPLFTSSSLKLLEFCRRVFVFPSQFALLSFPTCSPFYITDYHHKPRDYLSFHLCFSSKCLKALTKTYEKIDLPSKLVWQVFISDQLATALMKVWENLTHVSLSHILVISRPGKRAHLLSSILYSSSWIINPLLDGLVCGIVGHFYSSLILFFTHPTGSPKYSVTCKNVPRYYTLNLPIRYIYYIDTDEIPGFFLLLKNHIFISCSEDTILSFTREDIGVVMVTYIIFLFFRKYKYYCLYFSFITLYPSFITFLWQVFFDGWPL